MVERASYEQDFFLWTREQADALRDGARFGTNLPVDWENIAEEIESLGRADRRELASRIGTIIEHLLKLQSSPATDPRPGWRSTILRARAAAADILDESPSLRRATQETIQQQMQKERLLVARELTEAGERLADVPDYTEEQVLGEWLPTP